ncbi:signal peptidase II [Nanoarchaeota archaeon]
MKKWHINSIIIIALLALDQLTKYLASNGTILFDTKFLAFNLVKNTGASFGMLQDTNIYLIWVSIIALGAIMYYYNTVPRDQQIALVLVSAGIIGNFIDRVLFGFVIDFIDLKFWPVFNVADSCISIGVVWLAIMMIRR